MKKVLQFGTLLLSTTLLVACAGGSNSADASKNKDVSVVVKEGEYVLPPDESADSTYLALKVQIKNTSGSKLDVSPSDLNLYDEDGEKIGAISVYDTQGKFETLGYQTLSDDKSVTGYVVYEVDKEETYTLSYAPFAIKKEIKEVELEVDPSKYTDRIEDVKKLAETFVNGVFLNDSLSTTTTNVSATTGTAQVSLLADKDKKDSKKTDSKVENTISEDNMKEAQKQFLESAKADFEDIFYYYTPSDAEIETFVQSYITANTKRAKVTYTVKSYLPGSVVIGVRPEVVDLSTVDTYAIINDFVNQNTGKYTDYSEAERAAEKYLMENMPKYMDSANLATNRYMDKNGFRLILTEKSEGVWEADLDDYDFESMISAFSGGI